MTLITQVDFVAFATTTTATFYCRISVSVLGTKHLLKALILLIPLLFSGKSISCLKLQEANCTLMTEPFAPPPPSGVNFTNIFMLSFKLVDPKSVKNTVKSSVSFYAFGICRRKSCTQNVDEIEPESAKAVARAALSTLLKTSFFSLKKKNQINHKLIFKGL